MIPIIISILTLFDCYEKRKLQDTDILGVYIDNEIADKIPAKGEAMFSKAVCDHDVNYYWDEEKWGLFVSNLSNKNKCNLYFVNYSDQTIFNFDYNVNEQIFNIPVSGTYKLEAWGAQGGGPTDNEGGATHIALTSGLFKNLGNNISDIILFASGGCGFYGGGQGKTAYGSGGGSSYIGNPLLTNKAMYCYNCEESSEDSTKTISTTCSEENPTEIVQNKVTVMLKLL